jgi:hypothetical protein
MGYFFMMDVIEEDRLIHEDPTKNREERGDTIQLRNIRGREHR